MSNIENSSIEEVLENDSPSFFMKLIHLWILPSIYAVILGSIILHFTGVSFGSQFKIVKAVTSNLVAKQVKSDKKTTTKKTSTSSDNKNVATSGNNSTSKSNQSSTDKGSQTNTSTGTDSKNQNIGSSVSNTLSSMDPRVTAKLLSYMKADNALKILKQLDSKTQSAIISELPSDEGARMTEALASGYEPATSTTTASQLYQQMKPEQIATILSGIKSNEEILNQIKQMDPNTASKVITQLKPDIAGWVVTQLKP